MSTCPENDIHSVYLDGELPPAYMAQYEEHIAACPKCRARLESLKALHNKLQADSASIKLDSKYMDDSFARLMTKSSYKKNTAKSKNVLYLENARDSLKYVVTGVAAAAVVALVIPVRGNGFGAKAAVAQTEVAQFTPVARTNMVSPASMSIPGEMENTSLASMFADFEGDESSGAMQVSFAGAGTGSRTASPVMPAVHGAMPGFSGQNPYSYAQSVSNRSSLASYNVFGPVPTEDVLPPPEAQKKGFSFRMSSPLGNISLEIGNGN